MTLNDSSYFNGSLSRQICIAFTFHRSMLEFEFVECSSPKLSRLASPIHQTPRQKEKNPPFFDFFSYFFFFCCLGSSSKKTIPQQDRQSLGVTTPFPPSSLLPPPQESTRILGNPSETMNGGGRRVGRDRFWLKILPTRNFSKGRRRRERRKRRRIQMKRDANEPAPGANW